MNENNERVNNCINIAALANVNVITFAIQRAITRPAFLPGVVVVSGPSGYGKTFAASYASAHLKAYYVSAKSTWTKKTFLSSVLSEMGISPARTVWEMMNQVCEQLAISQRPLIIDRKSVV